MPSLGTSTSFPKREREDDRGDDAAAARPRPPRRPSACSAASGRAEQGDRRPRGTPTARLAAAWATSHGPACSRTTARSARQPPAAENSQASARGLHPSGALLATFGAVAPDDISPRGGQLARIDWRSGADGERTPRSRDDVVSSTAGRAQPERFRRELHGLEAVTELPAPRRPDGARSIWRAKWWILLAAIVAGGLAYGVSNLMQETFRSSTIVRISVAPGSSSSAGRDRRVERPLPAVRAARLV